MPFDLERVPSPESEESIYEQVLQAQLEMKKRLEDFASARATAKSNVPGHQPNIEGHLSALEEANRQEQTALKRWVAYVREQIEQS